MHPILKTLHMLGLAAFVGTVLLHLLIIAVADPADPAAYAALMEIKDTATKALIVPGMAILGLSGMASARRLPRPWPLWLKLKLALVAVTAANGLGILLPAGAAIAGAAAAGPVPPDLLAREAIAGAVNVVLILVILGLSVARPRSRRGEALS